MHKARRLGIKRMIGVASVATVGVAAAMVGTAAAVTPLVPAPTFAAPAEIDATPRGPVSIGDVNGDGTADLVAPDVAVHLGDGDGTFQPVRLYSSGGQHAGVDVVVGDLTGDGEADVAVTDLFAGGVRVLPGPLPEPRLPDFPEPVPGAVLYPTGASPGSLRIGDLDHQGPLDVVVANSGDDTVSVLLADGTGGFHPPTDYPAPSEAILPYAALALADVDGTGDLDIVIADWDSNTISVLLANAGGGTFQPAISFDSEKPVAVAVGDLDGDPAPDLVVGGQTGGLAMFLGNGDGTFDRQDPFLLPLGVREGSVVSVELADLNLDGNAEVVLGTDGMGGTTHQGRLVVLGRRGDGTFTPLIDDPLGDVSGAVWTAVGDLDLDGRPDLAATNEGVWTRLNQMGPRTAMGATVIVVPFDPDTGAAPVTITFNDVTQPGDTTAQVDEVDEQIQLQTTAQFAVAQVCFSYTGPVPTIAHFDQGAAEWTVPSQLDTGAAICVDEGDPLHGQWVAVVTTGPDTPVGSTVVVNPLDPTTGTAPVTITFANVTFAGETTVTSSSAGPAVPSGFRLAGTYYELTTTAEFDSAEVCFTYSGQPRPSIVHWVGGMPVIEPVTVDTGTAICAAVTSFSPFALVVPVGGGDTVAPVIVCGAADGAWHGENVSIGCTATDEGSGLADAADATFTLSTSVPAGTDNPDAATGIRDVCDTAGNCATAGPIGGNKVDRKAPTLSLPADKTADATAPTGATVTFTPSASDGAHANPTVACTPGTGSVFAIGKSTVACTATDHVGNQAGDSFTVTVLGPKEQLSRLIQGVVSASQLPAAVKTQLLAKLQPVVAGFDPNNPAHRRTACTALRAFTVVLRLLAGHGVPPAQATAWITDADRIRAVIGC